jgi:DNA-binding transcriptional ArsR family regulator
VTRGPGLVRQPRHLRVLREAGLVEVRQEAQRRVYSLRPEPLAEVDEWLGRYQALWEQRLEALHTEIARGERERRSTR